MPFSLGISEVHSLRWIKYTGHISLRTVQSANSEMRCQDGWKPGLDFYVDIKHTEDIDIDFADMMSIANLTFRGHTDETPAKLAVCYRTEHQYGMARILASAVESTQNADVELFEYESDALKWLNCTVENFNELRELSPATHTQRSA